MNYISNANLKEADSEVFEICENELERQTDHLEMIASENFTSPAVMEAMGSVFKGISFCPTGGVNQDNQHEFLALNNVCDSMGYFSLFKGGIYSVDKRVCDFTTSILKSNCSADKYCSNFTPTIEVLGDFKVFPERDRINRSADQV